MKIRSIVTALVVLFLVAACGDSASPASGETTSTPAEAADTAAARGELVVGTSYLPGSLDPLQEGYTFIQLGMGETLTRTTPDQQIEPWLAESVVQVDDVTWEVTLRPDATFWDGSPVTAADVKETFERSLEQQAAAVRFMDPATIFEVDDEHTLRFILPEPRGSFLNNLATFHFLVYKEGPDGPIMTGPYQTVRLATGSELELASYDGHWAGVPPIASITIRLMGDASARTLALQSGEVHLVTEVPQATRAALPGHLEAPVVASSRYHHLILNHARMPFSDPAARLAFASAIDRGILNSVVFSDLGKEMTHLFPPGIGFSTPPEIETGLDIAAAILDSAGWLLGDDGIRTKDGNRFAFTIYSYGSRPELTPMAISMQDQLGQIGIEVEVLQVDDIIGALETGDFDASMFSINMLPIGDPHYALNVTLGTYNYGAFHNEDLDAVVEALQLASDPAEKDALLLQALEIMNEEIVNIYLIAAPRIVGYNSNIVENVTLHPNDLYLIDNVISVK